MDIEQAVFTSAQTRHARGYHLVARSPGIDDRLATKLALWSPSENALLERHLEAESLNYFEVDEQWVAISRTVYGGAEYSNRGEFRLETNLLAMRRGQLAGYDAHPLAVVRAALASGALRLRTEIPATLPRLKLPTTLGRPCTRWSPLDVPEDWIATAAKCDEDRQLVIVGTTKPLDLLQAVFHRLPLEQRLRMTFSTGLRPSAHRPFRLHFLPQFDAAAIRDFEARGMTCLVEQPIPSDAVSKSASTLVGALAEELAPVR